MTYNAKSYGTYVYVDLPTGLGHQENTLGYRHRQSKSFNQDGAFAINSLNDPRRMAFSGILTGAGGAQDAASLRTAWDLFAAAHQPGPALPLMLDSDRFLNAQVEQLTDNFDGLSHQYKLSFLCFDPFLYAANAQTTALSLSGATVITTAGTVYSRPQIVLTATAAGGTVTVANAQDTSFTFTPPAAGTFTIDCLAQTVTDIAGNDQTAYFAGSLLQLVPGLLPNGTNQTNSLTVTSSGGAAMSGASITWFDRWV